MIFLRQQTSDLGSVQLMEKVISSCPTNELFTYSKIFFHSNSNLNLNALN